MFTHQFAKDRPALAALPYQQNLGRWQENAPLKDAESQRKIGKEKLSLFYIRSEGEWVEI